MAFTGTAAITQITDNKVLITGLSLAGSAAGTIGLSASTGVGAELLPASFKPSNYKYPGNATALTRAQTIKCTVIKAAVTPAAAGAVVVVKSGADTDAAFLMTLTNVDAGNASGALEIWVEWH